MFPKLVERFLINLQRCRFFNRKSVAKQEKASNFWKPFFRSYNSEEKLSFKMIQENNHSRKGRFRIILYF